MRTTTRTAAAASVVLMPLFIGIGDQLRIRADGSDQLTGSGLDQTVTLLRSVHAHAGLFAAASWFFYAAALLTVPMTIVLWRLAVQRSRRWAWAGAVLGALSALGQFAHLMGEFAMTQVFAGHADLVAAAGISLESDRNVLGTALIVPFLLGMVIAPAVQAVALRRARVVPLWSMIAVLLAAAAMVVFGSAPAGSAAWTILLIAGFAPAAAAAMRPSPARRAEAATASAPVPAA